MFASCLLFLRKKCWDLSCFADKQAVHSKSVQNIIDGGRARVGRRNGLLKWKDISGNSFLIDFPPFLRLSISTIVYLLVSLSATARFAVGILTDGKIKRCPWNRPPVWFDRFCFPRIVDFPVTRIVFSVQHRKLSTLAVITVG